MFDYIRIATAVNDLKLCDAKHNSCDIISKIKDIKADLTVFPALCLTGATCGDLFFQSELMGSVKTELKSIIKATKNLKGILVVGAPLMINSQLFNCGVVIEKGIIKGIVPKTYLNTEEKRWFSSAYDLNAKSISSSYFKLKGDYEIPVGNNLLFDMGEYRFAVEIGEDMISPVSPSVALALNGAEIILNLSAICELADENKKDAVVRKSENLKCTYVYVSAGVGESTSDSVFSGKSIVSENGCLIKENENYIDNNYVMLCDTDAEKIRKERKNVFYDTLKYFDAPVETVYMDTDESESTGELYEISKTPFDSLNKFDVFKLQVAGLKRRIEVTNSRPVLGISGGLDSTLALLVCYEAVRQLGKDGKEILAVTMPGFGTTDRTYQNALKLMKTLNAQIKEISIKSACEQHFSDIGHDKDIHDVTYENSQARERTQILMDLANKVGGFVVGTGDLSELALGWCTYNGDQMSMYGVNAGVPKTLIRGVIESTIENGLFKDCADVLGDILDTPISPELLPPDKSGKIAQKTEDLVGPYVLHDFFIYYVVKYGFTPKKIYHLAKKAFKDEFSDETILKWEKVFYRRFFNQQFKRSAMPDGVKVGAVSLSPKDGLKMPSDAINKLCENLR